MTTTQESFSIQEVAKLLGTSRWTVQRLVREKKLAAFRVRSVMKIHLSEVRRYKRETALAVDRPET